MPKQKQQGFKKIQLILHYTFKNYTFGSKNASQSDFNLLYLRYTEMTVSLVCGRYMERILVNSRILPSQESF